MQAVVTGATGLLGANLAIELLRQGHRVRATRRRTSRIDHLAAFDIEWCDGDLSEERALTEAFAGTDAVFHCAATVSIGRIATRELIETNVGGTASVLAAVRAARVPRLVHCSTVATVGLSEDGRPCTEDARWNFAEYGMVNGYVTTKRQAEDLVKQAVRNGLDAVIVNPTYMLGPYDARPSSGRLILEVARGRMPFYPSGMNNFVDVRDVARGMTQAWQYGTTGERYILGGDNLSYRELATRIAHIAGVAPPRFRMPRSIAVAVGVCGDVWERLRTQSRLNSTVVQYGFTDRFQFSSAKAQWRLRYQGGSLDDAIAAALAWFRRSGLLA